MSATPKPGPPTEPLPPAGQAALARLDRAFALAPTLPRRIPGASL